MQDEINDKVIALSTQAVKFGAAEMKSMIRRFLELDKEQKLNDTGTIYHGKQTLTDLKKQNEGLSSVEITDGNIKSFEKIARKFDIDFALKRDSSVQPPLYIAFFKAKDMNLMNSAFRQYTAQDFKALEKPSIRVKLTALMAQVKKQLEKVKQKSKDRGQEL